MLSHFSPKHNWIRIGAALISGGSLAVISPPLNFWWLHWISWVPLLWALYAGTNKSNFWLGYLAGTFGMFCNYTWLVETLQRFAKLNLPSSIVGLILFASVFGFYYGVTAASAMWFRRHFGGIWVFFTPALHVALEHFNPSFFPYTEGISHYRVSAIFQLTSVTGTAGITFLLFLVNCTIAESLFRKSEQKGQPIRLQAFAFGLLIIVLGFGAWRHQKVEHILTQTRTIKAAILQQDTTIEERQALSPWELLDSWRTRTEEIIHLHPDLVVWPESSTRIPPLSKRSNLNLQDLSPVEFFRRFAKEGGFHLLIGGAKYKWNQDAQGKKYREKYNASYSFTRDGEQGSQYDKMILVPFGEYTPMADLVSRFSPKTKVRNFTAGTKPTVFRALDGQGNPYTYTTPICYEAILDQQMGKLSDADLFVNITNDAWFGDTRCPHQHAMLTAAQAVQYGRPLLRIAYTGVSWVVEPHGDILYETGIFEESTSVESIRLGSVETLYKKGGWLFPYLCSLLALGAFFIARRQKEE